jgi:methionine-gamma-lyase
MTSTYAFETPEAGEQIFPGEREGYVYGRTRNPTQALLRNQRRFGEAEAGLAVASGMAVISSSLWTLLQAGDEVVIDYSLWQQFFYKSLAEVPRLIDRWK